MDPVISPIAIDLGGKYTGIYMPHYEPGVIPDKADALMATLVLPEDGDKMTWSQAGRTATRHRIRSNKRRKLAKRLLKVTLEHLLSRPLIDKEWNALTGLLNRRGYNRLEIELDMAPLEEAPSDFFAELLPDYFTSAAPLSEQWESLQEDIDKLRELAQQKNFQYNKRDAKKAIFAGFEAELDTTTTKDVLAAYHTLQDAVSQTLDSLDYGHQHRRDYLQKIKQEITKDSRLAAIRQTLPADDLYQLLGNVSNFQLRNLRWYFNDCKMAKGDFFDNRKLRESCIRWLQGWHPQTDEEIQNRKRALAHLHQHEQIIPALCSLDPLLTIPPYEDQNNRRPPKDQTLWINPVILNIRYGDKWKIWTQNLLRNNTGWDEGIEPNLHNYERKSRLQRNALPASDTDYAKAILLQRFLDRSRMLDPYALRLLCRKHDQSRKAEQYLEKLTLDLGSQHINDFLQFAHDYYRETANARQGIWFQTARSLLEKADINPPSKKKIKNRLVGNILYCELDKQQLDRFLHDIWEARVQGVSTVRSICKNIEDMRKTHGNSFNHEIEKLAYRLKKDPAAEKKLKGEEKEIWTAHKRALLAAETIARLMGHNEEQARRYANSFSMAQLYTILETDRHGFSKISLAAHNETAWRMQLIQTAEDKISARCSRLPADSVRPFDGILRRMLERQAHEIARLKIRQLQQHDELSGKILIPLIAEENRFEFTIGLANIKKKRGKLKLLEKQLETQQGRWQDKTTRIKESANGLCPYTGEVIGQRGEIDHIVPRSHSLEHNSTVFNSEANLIWASRRGNQDKTDQRKTISELHPRYLQQVFGTSDTQTITQTIHKEVEQLPARFIFTELTPAQQQAVRHALFLPPDQPAYRKVFASLATQQSSRVNGTQAWLIKRIIELLEEEFADSQLQLEFIAARVNAEQTSLLRQQLGEYKTEYRKQDLQSVASHSLDALCAFAVAAGNELHDELKLGTSLLINEHQTADLLASLITDQIAVQRIERKVRYEKENIASQTLFKEGIYAENFLHIWVANGKISIGFDGYNQQQLLPVEGKQPDALLDLLKPVLEQPELEIETALEASKPQKISIDKHRAFEHLHRVATQKCDRHELKLADLLEALCYTTANKDCQNALYDAAKKTWKKADDILKKDNFNLKIKFSGKLVKFSGSIQLPSRQDWQKLLHHPDIAPHLGSKNEPINWRKFFEQHFNIGSKRIHHKTRRVYSLPMLDAPSGGFRVRRITATGEPVWQLMSIEGLASQGFQVVDGKILWNQTRPIAQLNSGKLTELKSRYFEGATSFVAFNHWLPLQHDLKGITSLTMAPGTKDRCYIRITQPFAIFRQWLADEAGDASESHWALRSEVKVDAKKFADAHGYLLLGVPRSNLFIEKLGKEITYWYRAVASTNAMKEAYQATYAASMES